MYWTPIVQSIGTFAVGSGIFALLVKSLVVNSLNRELEAYKSKLNTDLEAHKATLLKDVEAFKSTLQLATIEHQVRFSKLHDKRAVVIQDLYGKLVALDTAIHSVLKKFQQMGEASLEDKVREYGRLHNELNEFFLPNKLFFDTETCRVIDELLFLSRDTYFDITTYPVNPESPEYNYGPRDLLKERHEYWEKARKVFDSDIQKLKIKLEAQFRAMLGVKEYKEQK
jgi:hypothetical protein